MCSFLNYIFTRPFRDFQMLSDEHLVVGGLGGLGGRPLAVSWGVLP